ncbi:MAG TPA: ribokinase [Bauldia sp.]|nr:ribokinase [Bauldia sp.]
MITVFGSINADLVCRVERHPKPGETVRGSDYALFPGGKGANPALAARRAGAHVKLVGAVGDDDLASVALSELEKSGVDLFGVARVRGPTGVAIIIVDGKGENSIVVSSGANNHVSGSQIAAGHFTAGDTLILQLEVPMSENRVAVRAAAAAGARVIFMIAPFAPVAEADLEGVSIIVVNEHEAADFARHLQLDAGSAEAATASLARRFGKTVIATLGPDGAVAAGPEGIIRVPALKVTPVDTTGAGDTFAGVLAAYLDEGADLRTAMAKAAIAGSLTCTREGAQPSFPMRAEIEAAFGG